MHLCMASSIRAMPEKEKPPAMRVDLYCILLRRDDYTKNLHLRKRYQKRMFAKNNERLVVPCQALLAHALACSTYICVLANTPRRHPPKTGKKLWPSPHRKRAATKRTARKLY